MTHHTMVDVVSNIEGITQTYLHPAVDVVVSDGLTWTYWLVGGHLL